MEHPFPAWKRRFANITKRSKLPIRSWPLQFVLVRRQRIYRTLFAGQQEAFLNVRGIDNVLLRVREVFASLYNDRAILQVQGYDHRQVALSAGIQQMVRSDIGAAGVMFTLDTESGFKDAVFITAYGLGETVVQGSVDPDEFYVYKPGLAAGNYAIVRRNLGTGGQDGLCRGRQHQNRGRAGGRSPPI